MISYFGVNFYKIVHCMTNSLVPIADTVEISGSENGTKDGKKIFLSCS